MNTLFSKKKKKAVIKRNQWAQPTYTAHLYKIPFENLSCTSIVMSFADECRIKPSCHVNTNRRRDFWSNYTKNVYQRETKAFHTIPPSHTCMYHTHVDKYVMCIYLLIKIVVNRVIGPKITIRCTLLQNCLGDWFSLCFMKLRVFLLIMVFTRVYHRQYIFATVYDEIFFISSTIDLINWKCI